jgi:hypothetical protein
VAVTEIIDRWLDPGHRYFKLRGDDGGVYLLRQDTIEDRWELILYDSGRREETRLSLRLSLARELMADFARRTGLVGDRPPTRYLWTDAFAVCNFLGLAQLTDDAAYRALALRLVDQVHQTLGRHRADDPREGWISGLDDAEAERHPTKGGLRIGKPLGERRPDEPIDERLEWDRDGQYFHYLTRWMHALACASQVTGEPGYVRWAAELAETAVARFSDRAASGGPRRMAWKMSIDLSRPLVDAQGQHDPLDGLVTCLQLRHLAAVMGESIAGDLSPRIDALAAMCTGQPLATADPLGIGGLLAAAHTLARLAAAGQLDCGDLLLSVLAQARPGLAYQLKNSDDLCMPADDRLAFRELGLSIGLRAVKRMQTLLESSPRAFDSRLSLRAHIEGLRPYLPLIDVIERFWLQPENRNSRAWRDHEDINAVMLATSLAPDGYLAL